MVTFWATFLHLQIFYIFTYISSFKTRLVVVIFGVQNFGNCFGYFFQKLGDFFQSSGHTSY